MKIGYIYVNGWASPENPHAAGICVGPHKLLYPDGKTGDVRGNKAIVQASGHPWRFEDLKAACRSAIESWHEAASAYASEVLWPAEFDEQVRAEIWRGERTMPSFEEWSKVVSCKPVRRLPNLGPAVARAWKLGCDGGDP